MYNSGTMLSRSSAEPLDAKLRILDPVELFQLCAFNRENSDAWSEFLRRYTAKLKHFIHGTLRQVFGYSAYQNDSTRLGIQESDLFQNAIVRLVENDCAAMKRFSGTSENELLAYMAVICRSAVLDVLRRDSAFKRRPAVIESEESIMGSADSHRRIDHSGFEREILVRELMALARHTIGSHHGNVSDRDQLVFELYFFNGLSFSQIAQCRGINLSKAGVEKLLKRLVGRVQTLASSGKSEETLQ
jgi:RNA polymerase sigma factor (sigma-70 family)